MNLVVKLFEEDLPQIPESCCLKEIIFVVMLTNNLASQIEKIYPYMQFLQENIHVKTHFRIEDQKQYKTLKTAAVGGTFDHLHLGHQVLLLTAVASTETQLFVGITGQSMLVKKKGKEMLQSWSMRRSKVQKFIKSLKPDLIVHIEQLNDIYGWTLKQSINLEGLILSEETFSAGDLINNARANIGLSKLQLITCPTISVTKNVQNKLSSSYIRQHLLKKSNLSVVDYQLYKSYYNNLMTRLGIEDSSVRERWWNEIFDLYSEGWRFYHTNQHIYRLLKQFDEKERKKGLVDRQINIVQLAIFFHDIIYYPNSSNNEEQSAQLLQKFIKEILQDTEQRQIYAKRVVQLILQTKNHEPTTNLSQILYDLDMGILNDQENYKQYAKNIKMQYKPFVKQLYNEKRLQFLRKTIGSKTHFSYKTDYFIQNCQWEIKMLEQNQEL